MERSEAEVRRLVERALERGNGILRLTDTWVPRAFSCAGRHLGLPEDRYDMGERGQVTERWLGSTTRAANEIGPPDEGLSYARDEDGTEFALRDAVIAANDLIAGAEYAAEHDGLGRLAKVFNFGDRLFYHYHQMEKDAALVGARGKDEAYYFPENVDLGPHPEIFFGVHPYIAEQNRQDILLPYLVDWDSDLILRHTRGYVQVHDDGFYLPSGIGHAPGTAVTIELQEDSDVFSNLQALLGGTILSKDLLYHSIRESDRRERGERVALEQLDWEANGDPYFYENHHTPPVLISESANDNGREYWIFYNTPKFSGKKTVIEPHSSYSTIDRGVYNLLVWEGAGEIDGHAVEAGNLGNDELLVSHERAIRPITIRNSGSTRMVVLKFYGADINPDVPMLARYGR